jgi:hypothetical protein
MNTKMITLINETIKCLENTDHTAVVGMLFDEQGEYRFRCFDDKAVAVGFYEGINCGTDYSNYTCIISLAEEEFDEGEVDIKYNRPY